MMIPPASFFFLCVLSAGGAPNGKNSSSAFAFTIRPNLDGTSFGFRRAIRTENGLRTTGHASDLLYQEQEKLIIDRGELEEALMSGTSSPLVWNRPKVRGVGGGKGFGSGSGGGGTKETATFKAEGKAYAKTLRRDGVVRIDDVLSSELADETRDYVRDLRIRAERDVEAGIVPPLQRFASVLLRKDRCDLTLPLGTSDVLTRALHDIFLKSPVAATMEQLLTKQAVLYELSTLISDPGSQRQVVHPDTPCVAGEGPVLYTCFIALQDVERDMGPTVWLPGTHTIESHEKFNDKEGGGKDELLKTAPSVAGTLPKGSCAIFDSRCLHCGSANRSFDKNKSRALLYFSFKNPKVGYPGNPPSIRPELKGKLKLKDVMAELDSFGRGDGCRLLDEIGMMLK